VTTTLTLALPKGRLLDPALALLAGMGIRGIEHDSRRLLLADEAAGLRFILLKPADIPTYVEYGAADLGIVGKDILLEQQPDVYEPVDLGFGFCRLVVAEPRELWERDDPAKWSWVRVATKYPRLTEEYFSERGIQVEMVKLDGSIELAPLVGLTERIVDLVQSGETLRANGLVEVAEILTSTARLIVNRASLKTQHARVNQLITSMREAVAGRGAGVGVGGAAAGEPPVSKGVGGAAAGEPPVSKGVGGAAAGEPPASKVVGGAAAGEPPASKIEPSEYKR
jgi:ATP phosphoribosyltransferase